MDQIGRQLAQVQRHLSKYEKKTKSVLSAQELASISDATHTANSIIDLSVTAARARSASNIQAVYDAADGADRLFTHALAVVANTTIVRKATSGMTTADEVDLSSIATAAAAALRDYVETDRRAGVISDTEHCTNDEILACFAADSVGLWAATLISHRGLRNKIDGAALQYAKDAALEFSRGDAMPVSSPLRILPVYPLLAPASLQELAQKLLDEHGKPITVDPDTSTHPLGGVSFIIVWHEYGSPIKFDFTALQIKNTAKSQFGGLTNEVLRRFDTMIKMPTAAPTGAHVTVMIKDSAPQHTPQYVYVLETYDGKVYSAWNSGRPLPSDRGGPVDKFLHGDADRNSKYHQIMEEEIVARMYDPMATSIARQYGDAKIEYSGSQVTEAAKTAVVARLSAMKGKIRNRREFMETISDREANIAAMIAATDRLVNADTQSLRVILKRGSSAMNFAKIIERHSHVHAPSDDEFAKYDAPDSLVDIAINSTLDAAFAEAKRVKTFADLDRSLADYVRDANRAFI